MANGLLLILASATYVEESSESNFPFFHPPEEERERRPLQTPWLLSQVTPSKSDGRIVQLRDRGNIESAPPHAVVAWAAD